MACNRSYHKLWNNYLKKYGDYRERSRLFQNENDRILIKYHSNNIRQNPITRDNQYLISIDHIRGCFNKKYQSFLLPSEFDELDYEKILQEKDFPCNVLTVNSTNKSLERSDSQIIDKIDINQRKTESLKRSSIEKSITKVPSTSHQSHTTRLAGNPYTQFIKRSNFDRKKRINNSVKTIDDQLVVKENDENIQSAIKNFLSFFHSLDDSQQNSTIIDEKTLMDLFSVDRHLSSSIYVPIKIQELETVPKTILKSLKHISDNDKISIEKSLNHIRHSKNKQITLNNEIQSRNFINIDRELNTKLSNSYTINAFKEYLIHRLKAKRLPKIFNDIES